MYFGIFQSIGTILGIPIIRNIVFGGPYWGLRILGNYYFGMDQTDANHDAELLSTRAHVLLCCFFPQHSPGASLES